MQIVIDIPEEEYRCVQITGCIGNETCISNAIYNGSPLPKGHGDLIDRNELLKEPMDTANYPSIYVRIAKAIIEADVEEYK